MKINCVKGQVGNFIVINLVWKTALWQFDIDYACFSLKNLPIESFSLGQNPSGHNPPGQNPLEIIPRG